MLLPDIPPKRGRRPLEPGRIFLTDLAYLLGCSESTVWRRYRPSPRTSDSEAVRNRKTNVRTHWERELDIRRRSGDHALHIDAVAAAEEIQRDQREGRGEVRGEHGVWVRLPLTDADRAPHIRRAREAEKGGAPGASG